MREEVRRAVSVAEREVRREHGLDSDDEIETETETEEEMDI